MKKTFALILALVMALVLLAGCGSSSGTGTATGEKAVTFSLLNGPISLDSATTVDGASLMVEIQLYNTLVNSKCGNSPEITPELATDWTVSDDGLTYTFHLRDDVTFHDGSQFTSADAVYTFERVMKEPYTSYLAVMIDSVEAPDSGTFVVHLLYPYADFLTTIGGIYFGICREDAITSSSDFMYKPVGTGPYMLEGDYVPGQAFSFVYNENYFGDEPDIKRINFTIQPDTNTAVIALQNGELDFVPSLTVNDIATVEADENLAIYQEPSYTIHYLTFNKTTEPFSIKAVREAFNYAINKQDLLDGAVDGVGSIANSPLNSSMMGYTEDIPFNEYDLEAAKAKLAEAGYHAYDDVVHAVNHIDITLEEGETLGLVGETGAGKTTTALGIMGLLPKRTSEVVSGRILFRGKDLLRLSEKELCSIRGSQIAMIFQDPMTSLNPLQKVGDQIAEVLQLHRTLSREETAKKVDEIMESVGLPAARKEDYPHQFSGGMKQRIVIAIALACNPSLLIADEPTTALDVTIQAQILHMIDELKRDLDTSMILITHDLGIVVEMCNKVAIMYAGEIVEAGTVEDIYEDRRHPYTIGLLTPSRTLRTTGIV